MDHSLGRALSRHRGSVANTLAGIVLSSLATAGAIALLVCIASGLWHANFSLPWILPAAVNRIPGTNRWDWLGVIFGVIADALFVFIAAFLWRVTVIFAKQVTTVHENGFSVDDGAQVNRVLWSDVLELVEVDVGERLPILKPPLNWLLPRWRSKRYEIWIVGASEPCCFDKNTISNIGRFGTALRNACANRNIPVSERRDFDA